MLDLAEEKKLIQKAARGNQAAFEALIQDCAGQVYGLALKMMKNREDAEDAAQEAFLKAWRSLSGFKGESRFSSWLYRLTYNTCLDQLRRRQRTQVISLTEQEEDEQTQAERDLADEGPGPEEQAISRERAAVVRREMDRLSDKLREPLLLRELGGRSYEEIAQALGISVGTVKSRISRARQALADALREDGTFSEYNRQTDSKGGDRT